MLSRICLGASFIAMFIVGAAAAPSATAAPPDDACALLTSPQVSAAVRTSVGAGSYVMPTFKKTCTWAATHAVGQGVKIVTLSFEGLDMFAAGMKAGKNVGVSATPISGIGDNAYYLTTGNLVGLHVKKGGVALKVAIYAQLPIEQVQAMEKTLAEGAVSKL